MYNNYYNMSTTIIRVKKNSGEKPRIESSSIRMNCDDGDD